MRILLTNDDGVYAPGLRALRKELQKLGEVVVVCATRHPGEHIDEQDVREYLRGRLASYKVPRRVLFVDEADISFSSSGQKVQLASLRALAIERLLAEAEDEEWASFLASAPRAAAPSAA